jgi:hypothetical protein
VPPLLRTVVALALAAASLTVVTSLPAQAEGACHAWPANYAATENAKPGDRGWSRVTHTGRTTAQFWLDTVSASCGQQVGVHLAASGATHFELWRLGFYRGARGRLMASWNALPTAALAAPGSAPSGSGSSGPPISSADVPPTTTAPGPLAQAAGAPAPIDSYPAYASASAASWPVSTTFRITPQMPPGLYELIGTGPDGVPTGAPLVVRDDLGPHALTIVAPTLTWQAYNPWGAADLYNWPNSDGSVGDGGQADVVTFDRPTYNLWSHAQLLGQDKGLVQLVNRDGMDVNWVASQDLHSPHAVLYETHAIVMSRHDEYWTVGMRAVTDRLVSRGVNLIDLGGNSMYHAGRFLDTAMRWYQVRKNSNSLHQNDAAYHVSYRFVDSLVNNPQARLIGENFNCISPWVRFVVSDPKFWAWAPQKLRRGRSFPNIVGSESDGPQAGYAAGTVFASLSPLHCTYAGVDRVAGFSYRVAGRSRAGVIDVGSMNWLCHLTTSTCGDYPRTTVAGERFVTRTTERILIDAAKGPLGRLHHAVGGVKPPTAASYPRLVR